MPSEQQITPHGDEAWAAAICAGTPPFSRLDHPAFRTDAGDAAAGRAWIDMVCRGSSLPSSTLLASLGVDDAGVARAFGRARLVADAPLPAWTECLVELMRGLPERPLASGPSEDSSDVGTWAFAEAASRLLRWETLCARFPFLDHGLVSSLSRQLATRVVLACGATLELENTTRADPVWDFSRGAWMERLCGFTALNFLIGTAVRQWRANVLELIERVSRDLPLLRATVFAGRDPGRLVAVDGDLGDRHSDGRSVASLTFASGARVVYKPKDSRCAVKLIELMKALNAAEPAIELPVRQVVHRGAYTWEEFVAQREATTHAETARFFRRFGMMLRVLQFVEGRDFWIDNLRVDGDRPIFIDLECILHPRIAGGGFRVPDDVEPELFWECVLPTAAVTQVIDLPGGGRQDFGGLSASGPRLLPFGMWSGYRDRRNGNMWLKGGRLYWAPDVAWPRPDSAIAHAADHLDEIEAGYRSSHQALVGGGTSWLEGPFADLEEVPVRVLMRSTWEYLVLLRASLEPSALLDANARELVLANVITTAHAWGCDADPRRRVAIARSELDALRVLDIPEFHSLPSNTTLVDTVGRKVADVFEGTALDRLRARAAGLDSFEVDKHVQILRLAVKSIIRSPG